MNILPCSRNVSALQRVVEGESGIRTSAVTHGVRLALEDEQQASIFEREMLNVMVCLQSK